MALGRGRGGDDKHTRSTAADQPAPLPDYKVTWLWGGGGGGGWYDKHTRSTAADQPAPLPDYKVTRTRTRTHTHRGSHMQTYARLHTHTHTQAHTCKHTHAYEHAPQGLHVNTHAHNHIHGLASIHSNICHETYTSHMSCDIHANKHKQAHSCSRMRVYKHTSRGKHINTHACATSFLQKAIPERSICAIPKRTIRATPKRPTARCRRYLLPAP